MTNMCTYNGNSSKIKTTNCVDLAYYYIIQAYKNLPAVTYILHFLVQKNYVHTRQTETGETENSSINALMVYIYNDCIKTYQNFLSKSTQNIIIQ